MGAFDFINNKVVGYVNISPSSYNNNVNIEVVGYCDYQGNFYELSENEALNIFSPRGNVFAHNFTERHSDKDKKLVCIGVKKNEKEGDNWDDYIWNKRIEVEEFAYPTTKIMGKLTDDGNNNYNVLIENDIYESDEEHFILSDNKVVHINSKSINDTIPYWNLSNLSIITHNAGVFVIVNSLPDYYDGEIDNISNDRLIDWYIKKILKKKWSEILTEKNFKSIEPYIIETVKTLEGIDGNVLESRMNRLRKINKSFVLTLEELQNLSDVPWFTNAIDKSIDKYKKEYLPSVVLQKEDEIKRLYEEKESVIASIDNQKNQLIIIEQELEDKNKMLIDVETKLDSLEERKEAIVNDFSLYKEIIGLPDKSTRTTPNVSFSLQSYELIDNKMPYHYAYGKSLENTFKANNIGHGESSTIARQIAAYNMLLVPDIAVAKAIVISTGKCSYMFEYVSASWKSFEDLWDNGLGYIIQQCENNPDRIHFLILQNINLTYLPNYLQPLVDIQSGATYIFDKYGVSYPSNLRILCTITDDEVIPLNKKCLKHICCVNPGIIQMEYLEKIIPGNNDNIGYLTTTHLADLKREINIKDIPNYYKEYIDE